MTASRLFGLTALAVACAAPAAPAPADDAPAAEELFRSFEKQAREARSLFVAYVGERTSSRGSETERSYYGGTSHLRPGIERVMRTFDQDRAFVCDAMVGHTDNAFGLLTRTGWCFGEGPYAFVLMPVREFRFVEPKAGADPPGCKIIAYTLYLHWTERTPNYARQVTLWLDQKSMAPLKRSVRWSSEGRDFEVTERYYGFSTAEVPEAFQREPVPAFILDGKLAAKKGANWQSTAWMVEGIPHRAEEGTRLLFGGGAKLTLAPTTEFIYRKAPIENELHLFRGRLSAELGTVDRLQLVLGPAHLASGPIAPTDRSAVITATPERVVVERGPVVVDGVAAEPSTKDPTISFSGRLLHEGVEYRLIDAKLVGQRERSLPMLR
jgi:hypothetical protein